MNRLSKYLILIKMFLGLFFISPGQDSAPATAALNATQLELVPIAAFAAKGEQTALKVALNKGLQAGLAITEIKEILVQLYAYAGFPRSLNAIGTFDAVVRERKEKGLPLKEGTPPSAIHFSGSKYEYGKANQAKLTGASANSVQHFVPVIDTFLKEHLFADIFGRDNIDWQMREIATVSTLASIGNADAQLRSHLGVARNTGLSERQLRQVSEKLSVEVSSDAGTLMSSQLDIIFRNSGTASTTGQSPAGLINSTFPKGQKVENSNFTGQVWVNMLTQVDAAKSTSVGNVTFAPKARSNWHKHPSGQILLITDGVGYYQEKGTAARVIRKGDIINCPPNLAHWHGASATESMSHIALGPDSGKGAVQWLGKVSDQEYSLVK